MDNETRDRLSRKYVVRPRVEYSPAQETNCRTKRTAKFKWFWRVNTTWVEGYLRISAKANHGQMITITNLRNDNNITLSDTS